MHWRHHLSQWPIKSGCLVIFSPLFIPSILFSFGLQLNCKFWRCCFLIKFLIIIIIITMVIIIWQYTFLISWDRFWLVNLHERMLANKCLGYTLLESLGDFIFFSTGAGLSCNIIWGHKCWAQLLLNHHCHVHCFLWELWPKLSALGAWRLLNSRCWSSQTTIHLPRHIIIYMNVSWKGIYRNLSL